ncbi:hypothetical protein AVEN_142138-1 [Araneus ventricosus]|uniref:Transposase Tc1-like domain-containing protein n=1 Tax=Araneus ventricosus TaxID=182803 RepID=A0A4Y2DFC0_ARAVE|nr:hypothetical protein AVEN_142138-1 [Araneus ventricosus]
MTNKRDDRQIQRLANSQEITVPEVQKSSGLWLSKDTILGRILETGTMAHCKMKKKPVLQPHHKSQRMLWARNHMAYGPKWHLDDIRSDSEDRDTNHQDESSSDVSVDEGPQPLSQSELNDLVRDLGLSKDGVELLWSRLKIKNLLTPGTSLSWYRHGEKEFIQFFCKEGNLVFCNDVQGLKKCFEIEYDPSEWHLFIDSSKTSLKAVLLHNGNSFASLP